jgi:polyhydroxyalkanoate synthesis regulator phasin
MAKTYLQELSEKKERLLKTLENEMSQLAYYRSEVKEYELKVEALQDQIDDIESELRGEVI